MSDERSDESYLWFTSTMSSKMNSAGTSTFNGLYMCSLDEETRTCLDSKLIVDSWDQNGEHHRGLNLVNTQIDKTVHAIYSGYFEESRNSFEILRADMKSPVTFKSFFRAGLFASNDQCKFDCCEGAQHTYHKVQPRDFIADGDDVFISWDGFYQDCGDVFSSKRGLQWTVGISKILTSPECISTQGLDEVSFAECTVPVTIAFQDSTANARLLGYAGFATGFLPDGGRVFFLSALDNDTTLGKLTTEVWAIRSGGNYVKDPSSLWVLGKTEIDSNFMSVSVDDVGTLRLRKSVDGVPRALCRTAYDAGIFCHRLSISDESGVIQFATSNTYVSKEQVAESCKVQKSDHYKSTHMIYSVSTGLEAFWDSDSPDDTPAYLVFGCYGEMNYHGNMTTAMPDGSLVQTLEGAYPGSILFGPDVHMPYHHIPPVHVHKEDDGVNGSAHMTYHHIPPTHGFHKQDDGVNGDAHVAYHHIPPTHGFNKQDDGVNGDAHVTYHHIPPLHFNKQDDGINGKSNRTSFTGLSVFLILAAALVMVLRRRKSIQRYHLPHRYERVLRVDSFQPGYKEAWGIEDSVSYVELTSTPERDAK